MSFILHDIDNQNLTCHTCGDNMSRYYWYMPVGFNGETVLNRQMFTPRIVETCIGDICSKCVLQMAKLSFDVYDLESLKDHLRPESNSTPTRKPVPYKLRWSVLKRDDFRCLNCGTRDDLCADHIIPESEGGETDMDNLQTLCRSCNSKKGTKTIDYRKTPV